MYKLIFALAVAVGLTACAAQEKKPDQPTWINNPGNGVSASAGTHVRGRHHQEELAVSRAREQLAARLGVKVEMTQDIREVVVNESATVTSVKQTRQEIEGGVVKARVQEKWHDTYRDIIWVWVVPVN